MMEAQAGGERDGGVGRRGASVRARRRTLPSRGGYRSSSGRGEVRRSRRRRRKRIIFWALLVALVVVLTVGGFASRRWIWADRAEEIELIERGIHPLEGAPRPRPR